MKNVIIGTAGHVDHGKTCLIKALTGMDTDRLKEEKKRGITIENGFADMLYGDYNISIIDVPGHEKFVRNMLAGIGGIDLVLLIVGLDEGIMPQTAEHFDILKMLKIKRGIVVLTKDDLVEDEDWKALVEEDVKEFLRGSFMEDAPIIRVSSYTGKNIEELKKLIGEELEKIPERDILPGAFRLPVDRVFTIEGHGTVITGTLMEGSVAVGDEIEIYPEETPVKVRNVQVHGENTDRAYAGQRTAINLAGIKKSDVNRGDVLAAPESLENSLMVDAAVEMFDDTTRTLLDGSRVHFYCGSSESLAKVVLMDREFLDKGSHGYAQLRLETPVAVKKGDRFIIRFYSPVESIGGGVVLDACPPKHKRNDKAVIDDMKIRETGSLKEILAVEAKEAGQNLITLEKAAVRLSATSDEVKKAAEELEKEGVLHRMTGFDGAYIHGDYINRVEESAENILKAYHDENPLSVGMDREEFRSRLIRSLRIGEPKTAEAMISMLADDGKLKISEVSVALADFDVKYTPEHLKMREEIIGTYKSAGYEMPKTEEVTAAFKDGVSAGHIIEALCAEGILARISYQYCLDREKYDNAACIVKSEIASKGEITLAEFRDAIGVSRKFAVEILEHFDKVKLTKKVGDSRVLY